MKVYIFFREGGFYAIELQNDADAVANAKCNEGTLRVEDTKGNIIWIKTTDT